jgi:hypothetical protein
VRNWEAMQQHFLLPVVPPIYQDFNTLISSSSGGAIAIVKSTSPPMV